MTDEQAFLDILNQNPADDTARLVYADWLDDRNEAAKATYLRRVVDLVRLTPGCGEYSDAAAGLFTVAAQIDASWRSMAGGRFEIVLVRYDPSRKILTVKVIRELTYWGLAEAKGFVESVPATLKAWATFENLFPDLIRSASMILPSDWGNWAIIRPSPWPCGSDPDTTFDVVLAQFTDDALQTDVEYGDHRRNSLLRGVAEILAVSSEAALDQLHRLPLTLATGLRPREVAAKVRDLWMKLNVRNAISPGGIQVIPRHTAS